MESWDSIAWLFIRFGLIQFVLERALYVIFEWSVWQRFESVIDTYIGDWLDLKPLISIVVGVFIAFEMRIDLVATLFTHVTTTAGIFFTGLYIAAGSKAVFEGLKRIREMREAKATAVIGAAINDF